MKTYEAMYITDVKEEIINRALEMAKAIIAEHGKMLKVDIWGKKLLAYTIQDIAEGNYVLLTFEATHEGIKELDRKFRNSEDVLRHMIISKGE